MSINYIGSGGLHQINNLKTTGLHTTRKNEGIEEVGFSSVLKETHQVTSTENSVLAQRTQKVAAIKEQVEAGSYKPDLEQVANSLANFLLDSE